RPPVKDMALAHGIPVFQPDTLKNNAEIHDLIAGGAFDAVIVVAYGKMIPETLIALPKHGFINVHASLLPKFRGASPLNRVLLSGCSTTGVSIMQIDAGMDSGPVFLQSSTPIDADEDAVRLAERMSLLGAEKLLEALALIAKGAVTPVPQDHTQATYAPMLTKEEGEIDWHKDAWTIHNMIRGLLPWPCAYTFLNGKMLKILSASFETGETGHDCGTLVKDRGTLKIACADGFITPTPSSSKGRRPWNAWRSPAASRQADSCWGGEGERP
ncbi:MAG TPA: methionyl-tRNA formyltransferase, partial [Deltaproteobacteria bacterium]|nr:methionyl-tRNA formyltransferase [Deltaproteobacteria bacterium]